MFFTWGALRDETVVVRPEGTGRPPRATLVEVVEPSASRVTPSCPLAATTDGPARCGGCAWMPLALSVQHAEKKMRLEAALARGGFEGASVELVAGEALGYRGRARFAFDARARRFGIRRARSRQVEDIARCEVLDPHLAQAWAAVRETLAPTLHGRGEIRLARRDEQVVVHVESEGLQPPEAYRAAEALASRQSIAGVSLALPEVSPAYFPDEASVRERTPGADGLPLEGTVAGFSQAHLGLNAALVERVRSWAATSGRRVLELFCGHGNLSVALAPGASAYRAVELDAQSIARLRENAALRGLALDAVVGDAGAEGLEGHDVLVLDPPRAGAEAVARRLREVSSPPERIVYVSCDHHTLGRDLALLRPLGYVLRAAAVFDMFPQTPHLESVVWLERSGDASARGDDS